MAQGALRLTCEALSARYRECGLLGSGDYDCTGQLDACDVWCQLQAPCDELSNILCGELSEEAAFWGCLYNCAAGPGGYICPSDGKPIARARVCDGLTDCAGGGDEAACPAMVCSDWRTLVPEARVCDGKADCSFGEDEEGCPDFVCDDGSELPHEVWCDGFEDCFDRSDELHCDLSRKTAWRCADGAVVPTAALCDGVAQCSDASDECGCATGSSCEGPEGDYVFVCGDGSVIAQDKECDQRLDCSDGSDEACSAACADGSLILSGRLCDGEPECADGSDELDCDRSRCDGYRDEPDGADERDCCDDPPCAELLQCHASDP